MASDRTNLQVARIIHLPQTNRYLTLRWTALRTGTPVVFSRAFEADSGNARHQVRTALRFLHGLLENRLIPHLPTAKQKSIYSALTAYFLRGKCVSLFFCFCVILLASLGDSRRLMARVCFGRRSRGRYFLPL